MRGPAFPSARMSIKPGHRTTEFWLIVTTAAAAALAAIADQVPPKWGLAITAALAGLYSLSRGLAKRAASLDDNDDDDGGADSPAQIVPRMAAIALVGLPILVLFSGCSTQTTRQIDRRPDGTEVSTRARSLNFMAGRSAVRGVKVTQTEKTQGMSVSGIEAESDATNLSNAIGAILMKGLATYLTGGAAAMQPSATPTPTPSLGTWSLPAGMKAVQRGGEILLVPADDPSTPHPEILVP